MLKKLIDFQIIDLKNLKKKILKNLLFITFIQIKKNNNFNNLGNILIIID